MPARSALWKLASIPAMPNHQPPREKRFHFSGDRGQLLIAILPVLVMISAAIINSHFTLLDDGVIVLNSRSPGTTFYMPEESGRFRPVYWIFNWVLFKLLPERAWALSFGNGLTVLASTALVYHLTRKLGGGLSGIVASWLFIFNFSATENLFTMSKAEPRQLPFWLASLAMLAWASYSDVRVKRWWPAAMALCAAAATLTKETGILLAVPLCAFSLNAILIRRQLPPGKLKWRLILAASGLAPLLLCILPILFHGLTANSYASTNVLQAQKGLSLHLLPIISKDLQFSMLLLGGIVCGALQISGRTGDRKTVLLLLWAQLLSFVLFLSLLPNMHAYYLYPAGALAAILVGATIPDLSGLSSATRYGCYFMLCVMAAWGVSVSVSSASALSAWSWLYGRLTQTVGSEKPARVLFYHSGGLEVHDEAWLTWHQILGVPVVVGLLDEPSDSEPFRLHIPVRELKVGDWVIEQTGTRANAAIPFRDLSVVRTEEEALFSDKNRSLMSLRVLHVYKASFAALHTPFIKHPKGRTFLSWRIYQVIHPPQIQIEGLSSDKWMSGSATLWLSRDAMRAVTLRMRPIAPPGFENRLDFYLDGNKLDSCPVLTGIVQCRFDPALLPDDVRRNDWVAIELRAAKTFSPRSLGVNDDPRQFSFNFSPTYEAGLEGLDSP